MLLRSTKIDLSCTLSMVLDELCFLDGYVIYWRDVGCCDSLPHASILLLSPILGVLKDSVGYALSILSLGASSLEQNLVT